jgi:Cytochrome P460
MKIYPIPVAIAALSTIVAVAAVGQIRPSKPQSAPESAVVRVAAVVDASGNLRVPDDYLTTYPFLGAWAVASERGPGSKELHATYASPGAVAAFRKDGRFPEGTTLVKEVFETATGSMTTGTVSHADTLKGWFVMVKAGDGRYPGNKLWGDGWGWSWFDAANPSKTTSTDYKADCLGCHVPARGTDWIYVGGYPPLKRAGTQ